MKQTILLIITIVVTSLTMISLRSVECDEMLIFDVEKLAIATQRININSLGRVYRVFWRYDRETRQYGLYCFINWFQILLNSY